MCALSPSSLAWTPCELDTHLFFRESYDTRDALVDRYQLKLISPAIPTIAEQHRSEGPNLWERDPDRCCHIRKVEPLVKVLRPYDAWISGIRRDQSPSRVDTPKVQWSERYQVFKIHPLADWDEKRIWGYIQANEIPSNPLHDAGIVRSANPCTRPRSGRGGARRSMAGSDSSMRHSRNTNLERKTLTLAFRFALAGKHVSTAAPFSLKAWEPPGSPHPSHS